MTLPRPLHGKRTRSSAWLALAISAAGVPVALRAAGGTEIRPAAPAQQFTLPLFTLDGYRSVLVRGETAELLSPEVYRLTGLQLTQFTGDASNHVVSVLLAPEAVVEKQASIVHGPAAIRLVRDEIELSGVDWRLERSQSEYHLTISHDVHLVFHASLPDILK